MSGMDDSFCCSFSANMVDTQGYLDPLIICPVAKRLLQFSISVRLVWGIPSIRTRQPNSGRLVR